MTTNQVPLAKRGFFSLAALILENSRRVFINILWAIILVVIFAAVIGGLFGSDEPKKEATPKAQLSDYPVFYARLQGKIVRDLSNEEQLLMLVDSVFSSGASSKAVNLRHLRETFEELADHKGLQAVVLELGRSLSGSMIDRLELANTVKALRENTDATVYVLSETGFLPYDYLIASAADKVVVGDMSAGVTVYGESREYFYIGDLLKNVGVDFYHASTGDHKTAGETLRLTEMSDGERDNLRAIITERWGVWKQVVEGNRPDTINLDAYPSLIEDSSEASVLDTLANRFTDAFELAGGDSATLALGTGLADLLSSQLWKQIATSLEISYGELVRDRSSKVADYKDFLAEKDGPDFNKIFMSALGKNVFKSEKKEETGPVAVNSSQARLGLLRLDGLIHTPAEYSQDELDDGITLAAVDAQLAALAKTKVDAILVEINSGGGDAIASELVRQAIYDFSRAQQIPVYIWMDSVAASGGYWIATLGEKIYAHPATITGSIGVVVGVPNFADIAGRYGINPDLESTHPSTNFMSEGSVLLKPINPRVQQFLETIIAESYSRFTKLVSDARDIPLPRVEELAGGRVYGAIAAQEHGLIDEVADRQATYTQVAEELGKTDYAIIDAKTKAKAIQVEDFFANFFNSKMQQSESVEALHSVHRFLENQLGMPLDLLTTLLENPGEPLVLCVACLDVDS